MQSRPPPSHPIRRQSRTGALIAITGITFAIAIVSIIAWRVIDGPASTPSQAATPAFTGSIVVSMPNRDECLHYQWDNVTGKLENRGAVDCGAVAEGEGRIEAISRAFRNK